MLAGPLPRLLPSLYLAPIFRLSSDEGGCKRLRPQRSPDTPIHSQRLSWPPSCGGELPDRPCACAIFQRRWAVVMVSRAAVAVSVIIRKASAILVTVWRFWDLIEFGVFVRSRLEPPDNGRAERFCEMTDALPTGSLSLLPALHVCATPRRRRKQPGRLSRVHARLDHASFKCGNANSPAACHDSGLRVKHSCRSWPTMMTSLRSYISPPTTLKASAHW